MFALHAAQALTPHGWSSDVRLEIDAGRIVTVVAGAPAGPSDERHGILLPAMANLHSHAFQRAMAGLAEHKGPAADDFWSWRDLMYRLALKISPAQMEAIAAQVYVEMLEAGFSRVGEFHYLHHAPDGRPYANIAEMAERIAAAASAAGIGLTLLPVFYAHADFGGAPPRADQRRFINDLGSYQRLLDGCRAALRPLEGGIVGVAPHSLRAVAPEQLAGILRLAGEAPIHIHIAEQVKEVEDCLAWSGRRPVDWLLDHHEVDARWCLVHATHMSAAETARFAASRAVAGLCPITEANLGDGIFDARGFIANGGRYGIGSDSNVQIGVTDELRALEYAQRLARKARNVLATDDRSTGRSLFQDAAAGGAIALGARQSGLTAGAPADVISLERDDTASASLAGDACLDAWIFTGRGARLDCVWVGGNKLVSDGRHHRRERVARAFRAAMDELSLL